MKFYMLVFQCYYDLKADQDGEEFTKRGLTKIAELQELRILDIIIKNARKYLRISSDQYENEHYGLQKECVRK